MLGGHLHDGCSGQRRSRELGWCQVEWQTDGIPAPALIERTVLESDGNRVLMRSNVLIIEEFIEQLLVVAHIIESADTGHLLEFNVAIHIF